MERNKNAVWLILCMAVVLMLSGCAGGHEGSGTNADILAIAGNDYITYTDSGVFYITGDGLLAFMDSESQMETVVCDRPGCAHDDKDCYAYFGAFAYACIEGDSLLILSPYGMEKVGDMFLYTADLNGANRKQIFQFDGAIDTIMQVLFTEDYVVISCVNNMDENYEMLDYNHAALWVYDRNAGTAKEYWKKDAYGACINTVTIKENQMYFYTDYSDFNRQEYAKASKADREAHFHQEIWSVSLADGTESLISEVSDENYVITFLDDLLVYCDGGDVIGMDVNSGNQKVLAADMIPVLSASFDQLICVKFADESNDSAYYEISPDGSQRQLGNYSGDISIKAIFNSYTHALYFGLPSGSAISVGYRTADVLEGALGTFFTYADQNGERLYEADEEIAYTYDPNLDVKIDGKVDSADEAFMILFLTVNWDGVSGEDLTDLTVQRTVENGREMYIFFFNIEGRDGRYRAIIESSTESAVGEMGYIKSIGGPI